MSSLDAVRARFARNEGLPFADILTEASIQTVLNEYGVSYRDRVFSPVTTIWGFLSQVLNEDHSCRDTVSRIIAHRTAHGMAVCSPNTASYCTARSRIPTPVLSTLARRTAEELHASVDDRWKWNGRSVFILDGSSVSMPDTRENQAMYPQPPNQKPGLGFPLARITVLLSGDLQVLVDVPSTHAAAMTPGADPLHKVTIIPRGMALGVTMQLPIDDRHNYTREYLKTDLAILMGGRLAEELFLNQMSTGAGNDIERATEMARKMVCEWGMSDLGPLTFGKKEEQIFLGREISQHRDYSEDTAIKIDGEVRKLVNQGYETAKHILESSRDTLQKIAAALLEREVLDASEVMLLVEGKELPPMKSPSKPDDGVQQVLKPEPGRGIVKGGESPARA